MISNNYSPCSSLNGLVVGKSAAINFSSHVSEAVYHAQVQARVTAGVFSGTLLY